MRFFSTCRLVEAIRHGKGHLRDQLPIGLVLFSLKTVKWPENRLRRMDSWTGPKLEYK
jgi:hypothetical protein